MGTMSIRLPDEEQALLQAVSRMTGQSMTDILRENLRSRLEEKILNQRGAVLPPAKFAAFLDELEQPMTAEELSGLKRLDAVDAWGA